MSPNPPRRAAAVDGNPFATQAKLLWHLDRLAEWRLKGDTFPVLLEVNLTNRCNMGCAWCISSYSHDFNTAMTTEEKQQQKKRRDRLPVLADHPERHGGLDVEVLLAFLAQARARGLKAVTFSGGGEPTFHPRFADAVRGAAALGLDLGLMTNGLFKLSLVADVGAAMRWVRVSLDTLDPARYEQQKATKGFPQVLATIRALVSTPTKVGVNMNLAAWNRDEIPTLARWCRDEGVDYFQVRPILGLPFEMAQNAAYRAQPQFDWADLEPALREAESLTTPTFRVAISWDKFQDVRDTEGNYGRTYSQCLYHYFICVLNADGDLAVCMYHLGDEAFSFGNIYENRLEEIWDGERRRKVVDMCANRLDLSTCQVCCKGHEINKVMHFLRYPDPATDVNFL